MKTLLVPDAHENIGRVIRILRENPADLTIFLGDWFDRFSTQPGDRSDTIAWLLDNVEDPKKIFLWGNHDVPYCFDNVGLKQISGYNWVTNAEIKASGLQEKMRKNFHLCAVAGRYLVSHAGFTAKWLDRSEWLLKMDPGVFCELMGASRKVPPFIEAGFARGGPATSGGITWLDWNVEFQDLPESPQIVGHTTHLEPQWSGSSLCLDTKLRHVGSIVDGSKVKVVNCFYFD